MFYYILGLIRNKKMYFKLKMLYVNFIERIVCLRNFIKC